MVAFPIRADSFPTNKRIQYFATRDASFRNHEYGSSNYVVGDEMVPIPKLIRTSFRRSSVNSIDLRARRDAK